MNPDIRRNPESEHQRQIQILADEAEMLAKTLDLTRSPSIHISRALRGISEGRERDRLFGEVRTELNRRKTRQVGERKTLEEAQQQILMEDAYKHEAQIDPREHDDDEEVAAK